MLNLMSRFTEEQEVPILKNGSFSFNYNQGEGYRFLTPLFLSDNLEFFKEDNPYWITEADFEVSVIGADIKLELWDFQGKENVVLPTGRKPYKKGEIVTFKIDGATSRMVLITDLKTRVLLKSLQILGRNIGELVSLMKQARPVWNQLGLDYDKFRESVASDIYSKNHEFLKLNSDTEDANNRLVQLRQALEVDQAQVETVSSYLSDMQGQHNVVTEQVNSLIKDKATLSSQNRALESDLLEKNNQLDTVSKKLLETREQLKNYKTESSLYSEDFSEYKSEINRQNTIYKAILLFLLFAGSILSFEMYEGVSHLSSDLQFNFDIWSLLVSRLPIISLNIFILGICSTIIYKMIELITKNNERISLTKQIAYLVKECSESQSEDLDLSDEVILTKRVFNKMSLIREFIGSQADRTPLNSKADD